MTVNFENSILVLLYNKEISASKTLNSLLKCSAQYNHAALVIWNNGPHRLVFDDVAEFERIGYSVFLEETLNNESLSVIYNDFILRYKSEKYIILDDDSTLNKSYILSSSKIKQSEVGMPVISSMGKITNPRVNRKLYDEKLVLNESCKILTIGSGLVIGKNIASNLFEIYGDVFDKRFYFYGVDSTFCFRLFESDLIKYVSIIPGFEHRLSRMESESSEIVDFRRLERSYDFGLTLRYYKKTSSKIHGLLKLSISTLLKKVFRRKEKLIFKHVIKAFFSGRHYRSKKN